MNITDAQETWTMAKYRELAYKQEADPLFLQFQREEIDKQVWLDKIAEIKTRYPFPTGCKYEDAKVVIETALETEGTN